MPTPLLRYWATLARNSDESGIDRFSWSAFRTKRKTTGAVNEKGVKLYGKAAKEALAQKAKQQPPKPEKKPGSSELYKQMADVFGLKGVSFGSKMPRYQRLHHLNAIVDAFHTLGEVTGLHNEHMGLGKTLHLKIGQKTRATAAAHYDPKDKSITIGEGNADAITHEWTHALDRQMGGGFTGLSSMMSMPEDTVALMSRVANAKKLPAGKERLYDFAKKWIKARDATPLPLRKSMSSLLGALQPYKDRMAQKIAGQFAGREDLIRRHTGYLTDPEEMVARAVEAHIASLSKKPPKSSSYLPHAVEMEKIGPAVEDVLSAYRHELGVPNPKRPPKLTLMQKIANRVRVLGGRLGEWFGGGTKLASHSEPKQYRPGRFAEDAKGHEHKGKHVGGGHGGAVLA